MTIRPFQVRISDIEEIRMGSPYYSCKIELKGFEKLKLLTTNAWQEKHTWSHDSKRLVLVKWNLEQNEPGFHFFIIDTLTGNTHESDRIKGLPNEIRIEGNTIKYNKFLLDRKKSKHGELCCNVDGQYALPIF